MADIAPVAAAVLPGTCKKTTVIAGETVVQGWCVYKKQADGRYYLSDADDTDTEKYRFDGLALNVAGAGQPLEIAVAATGGTVNLGPVLSPGKWYVISITAGRIRPIDDVGTDQSVTMVGCADSDTVLSLFSKQPLAKSGLSVD